MTRREKAFMIHRERRGQKGTGGSKRGVQIFYRKGRLEMNKGRDTGKEKGKTQTGRGGAGAVRKK